MAERYSRLWSLPEGLYAQGAPLVIAAGALLRDSQTGQILAQLKLRSISDKTISSVRVLVVGQDNIGMELCREEHLYDDLRAGRDAVFGAKEAVRLPNAGTSRFAVQVLTVSFSDGSRYLDGGREWTPLPAQTDLNQRLFDTELIRQYKLETGPKSRFVPLETRDLWLCACGEINHAGESCCRCGQTFEHCRDYLSVELLRENKSLRLNAEAAQAALDEARRQSHGRLAKRIFCVLLPLLLIAGAAAGLHIWSSDRAALYDEASRYYESGDYGEALVRFEKLGGFRDSKELAAKARDAETEIVSYNRAGRLLESGRFDEAYETYLSLGSYLDSAERAQESRYLKGFALIDEDCPEQARALFLELGAYRDSQTVAAHFFDRLLSEETSLNAVCGGPLTTDYRYDRQGRVAEKIERFSAYDGMEDHVCTYSYDADGGYAVSDGQTLRRYDAYGSFLGEGDSPGYVYEYEFYPDGSVHYCIGVNLRTGQNCSSVYDEHGELIATQNEDGTGYAMLNEYNGDRLARQERYSLEGVMLSRTNFEYDDSGLLSRASFLTPGADTSVTILYKNGPVYIPDAEA